MARRSTHVEISFVSAVAAAALSGCNAQDAYHRDWQQCVNQANVVVDDKWCAPQAQGAVRATGGYYHWWYSGRPYRTGSRITDGYGTPVSPTTVGRSSSSAQLSRSSSSSSSSSRSVSRGGFGSSSHFGGGS